MLRGFPIAFVVTGARGGKHSRLSERHAAARGHGGPGPGPTALGLSGRGRKPRAVSRDGHGGASPAVGGHARSGPGCAVVSGVFGAPDVEAAARALVQLFSS
jgi:hypothetical protein